MRPRLFAGLIVVAAVLAAAGAQAQLRGHGGPVRALAVSLDGRLAISGSFDTSAIRWSLDGSAPSVITLPVPLNAVAVAPDGETVAAGADGKVYVLSGVGELGKAIDAANAPIIGLAISADGKLIAAAGIRGSVAIIDR